MTMRRAAAAAFFLLSGCTGGGKDKGSGPCDFQFGGAGPVAQFKMDSACAPNPWPSDRLMQNGLLRIPESRVSYALPAGEDYDAARAYLQETADSLDVDGWSTIAPIHVVLDEEPDLATLADGVLLFRLDGATVTADATLLTATWDADLSALVVQPQTPLEESTTYGVIVTPDLLDADGRPTARSHQFAEYLQSDEALANDLALVAGAGVADAQVSLAFTFTTGTATDPMVAIRDLVFASPAGTHSPAYESPSSLAGLEQGYFLSTSAQFSASIAGFTAGSNLAAIANGTFDSWDFRGADLGAFDSNLVLGQATPPVNRLDFRLTIPQGTPPVNGWPLVIYAHGLGGESRDVYEWGDVLAARGVAVIGISAIHHGYRGTLPEFFDWSSMAATREHFRQTYADHLQLLRMVQQGVSDGLPPFDQLDASDVSYFGISLGGIMGSSFLSLAPDNTKGLLVVPGGHLSRELYAATVGATYFYPFIANRAQIAATDPEFPLFLKGFEMLVQAGLDPADPVNYARHVVAAGGQLPGSAPKRVLQTISVDDTYVTNETNFALQRALGIPELSSPTNDAGGVSGAWILDDADFPQVSGEEPHGYFSLLCGAQEMGFHWLESDGTDVVDPAAVVCP